MYSDIVHIRDPLIKVATRNWDSLWLIISSTGINKPITEYLSLRMQSMFIVEMESENFISAEFW